MTEKIANKIDELIQELPLTWQHYLAAKVVQRLIGENAVVRHMKLEEFANLL